MKFELKDSRLKGCKFGRLDTIEDSRGSFTKVFQRSKLNEFFTDFQVAESYITKSQAGVLRGMHFQLPPDDHEKIVICLEGHALDVILDLRSGVSFGNFDCVSLSENSNNFVFVPKGVAHGFFAYQTTVMLYIVSTEHSPLNDQGIMWDSFGFTWPSNSPTLSERDKKHMKLRNFNTPF